MAKPQPATDAPGTKMIRVRALKPCYIHLRRYRVGDVFTIPESLLSKLGAMEIVPDATPESFTSTTAALSAEMAAIRADKAGKVTDDNPLGA